MNYNSPARIFLPILFLVLSFGSIDAVLASEITGSLSSAGVNNSQNHIGTIAGEVANPVVVAVVNSGSGGGGGIVIDLAYTHEPGYLNSGGSISIVPNLDVLNHNLALSFVDTPANTYVAPKVYRYPTGNIAYTGNANRMLSFGGEDDFPTPTTTNELAQNIIPDLSVDLTQTETETGLWGLSFSAWMLLLALIILAMVVLYYLREEGKNTRSGY